MKHLVQAFCVFGWMVPMLCAAQDLGLQQRIVRLGEHEQKYRGIAFTALPERDFIERCSLTLDLVSTRTILTSTRFEDVRLAYHRQLRTDGANRLKVIAASGERELRKPASDLISRIDALPDLPSEARMGFGPGFGMFGGFSTGTSGTSGGSSTSRIAGETWGGPKGQSWEGTRGQPFRGGTAGGGTSASFPRDDMLKNFQKFGIERPRDSK